MIVGCGPSILDVNKSSLREINKSYFTVGFSFSMHLDIFYDLFYVEFGGKHQTYLDKIYKDGLYQPALNAYKSKKIKFLIHKYSGGKNFFEEDLNRIPTEIPSHISNPFHWIIFLISKLTKITNYLGMGFQVAGTLSYIIYKLINYGAKEIVLAGIDLDNSGYFFQSKKWYGKKIKDPYIAINKFEYTPKVHKTNDPKFHKITMSKFILLMVRYYPKIKFRLLLNRGFLSSKLDSVEKI